MTDRTTALRRASDLSIRNDLVIYLVKCCSDDHYYAVSEAVLDESFLQSEIEAECYPDGYIYDNQAQERH